jgi:hypothetical protein
MINKIMEVLYRLDLLLSIKIYLVYKNQELLVYEQDT